MESVKFKGIPCHTAGKLPKAGLQAPPFLLVDSNLNELTCSELSSKKIILNIFPSLDTSVCAMSVRKFNERAAANPNATVLCISMDLPFAMKRFCVAEGINNVITASVFRSPEFGNDYGVKLIDGPLRGLLTRAIVILDENKTVIYSQLCDEITEEPDYDAALAAIR